VYIHKHRKNAGRKIPHKWELRELLVWTLYIAAHGFIHACPSLSEKYSTERCAHSEKENRKYHLIALCLLSAS